MFTSINIYLVTIVIMIFVLVSRKGENKNVFKVFYVIEAQQCTDLFKYVVSLFSLPLEM